MYKISCLNVVLFSIGSISLLLEGVTSLIDNTIENGRGIKNQIIVLHKTL
jgi:hypothetical protein